MSNWNLENTGGTNASSLNNVPLDFNPPPIMNNEVLVYNGATQSFVAENIASAGGITNVIGVGSISPVFAVSAGIAELTGITGDGLNTTASLINTGHQIQIALDTNITVSTITGTGSTPTVVFPTTDVSITGPLTGAVSLNVEADNNVGSSSHVGIGTYAGNEGYDIGYTSTTGNLLIQPYGGNPIGGNITIHPSNNLIINTSGQTTFNGNVAFQNAIFDNTGSPGTSGQFLQSTGSHVAWENINFSAFQNAIAEFSTGTISVQVNTYYMDNFGATYTLPHTPPVGTVFGLYCQNNGCSVNSSNSVFALNNIYNSSCTITCDLANAGGNTLEMIFINNSGQISWNVTNIIGVWYFNGQKVGDVRDINDITNVTITSPVVGQSLTYRTTPSTGWINSFGIPGNMPIVYISSVLTPTTAISNRIYYTDSNTSLYLAFAVTLILPSTPKVGDRVALINGSGAGCQITAPNSDVFNTLVVGTQTSGGASIIPYGEILIGGDGASVEVYCVEIGSPNVWQVVNSNTSFISSDGYTVSVYQLLAALLDVSLSSPNTGDLLTYNGSDWVNQAPPAGIATLYASDGTLSGNRTVDQGGYDLTFTNGGGFQINVPDITMQTTTPMNFFVAADTSGNLNSYAMTQTANSVRFSVPVQNFTTSNNAMDIYYTTMSANATFLLDVYFTLRGMNDASCAHWKVTAGYSASSTGYGVIPMVQGFFDTVSSYILQGQVGGNVLQLRLVKTIDDGIGVGLPGTIVIVRHEDDYSGNTYTIPSMIPYNPGSINYELGLQNIYRAKTFNFIGTDITTMGSQTFYYQPGMTLWLSPSFSFYVSPTITMTQTISLTFYINTKLLGYALSSSYIVSGENSLSNTAIDLQPGNLIQSGYLVNGNNTISVVLSTVNGTTTTSNRQYCVTLATHF
jgi:hypothetical protein